MTNNVSFPIVLFQPEIPENTGAIGRTCVAVGSKLYLVKPLGFQLDEKKLRRAGMDYWEHLDIETVADWAELTRKLPGRRWYFSKKAVKSYLDADFQSGDALVFGNESHGLPEWITDAEPDRCLRIPLRPEARSLNLSVCVGIAVYEAARKAWNREKNMEYRPLSLGRGLG